MSKDKTTVRFTAYVEEGRPRTIAVTRGAAGWTAHGSRHVYEKPRGAAMSVARELDDLVELRSEHQRESAAEKRQFALGYALACSNAVAENAGTDAVARVLHAAFSADEVDALDLGEFDRANLAPCLAEMRGRRS